jgi:hypothetical protein
MGRRGAGEKNSFLIRGQKGSSDLILTVVTPSASMMHAGADTHALGVVTMSSKSARGHFRSCLLSVDHPAVMPPSELAYIRQPVPKHSQQSSPVVGYKLLVFREFVKLGSLRDVIQRVASPLDLYSEKQCVLHPAYHVVARPTVG